MKPGPRKPCGCKGVVKCSVALAMLEAEQDARRHGDRQRVNELLADYRGHLQDTLG